MLTTTKIPYAVECLSKCQVRVLAVLRDRPVTVTAVSVNHDRGRGAISNTVYILGRTIRLALGTRDVAHSRGRGVSSRRLATQSLKQRATQAPSQTRSQGAELC